MWGVNLSLEKLYALVGHLFKEVSTIQKITLGVEQNQENIQIKHLLNKLSKKI